MSHDGKSISLNKLPCTSCWKNTINGADYTFCCKMSRGRGIIRCGAIIAECAECHSKEISVFRDHSCEKVEEIKNSIMNDTSNANCSRYMRIIPMRISGDIEYFIAEAGRDNSFPLLYITSNCNQKYCSVATSMRMYEKY